MDYLYGKLNKEVEQNSYKGSISDTIKINIDDSTNVISGELVNNYFNFKIYDNLPAATEKTYLTFAVLDNGNTQSLYICLKHNDVYIWEQVQNLNCYYFDDLESTFEAINSNIYSEDNKEQLSSSVVRIITGLAVPIIDILADVTTESDLSISKSCIINLNGHTVTINNDGRLKFINSASPTEVIINAAGATIQRAGTQSAAKCLITFMGQSLTINGGSFKEYNSRDNAATMCSPLAVNNVTAKIYVYGARFEAAGRYRGSGTYLYKFSSFEATNSTFVGGALQASASAYSADQTMGIGFDCGHIDSSSATSIVKLNNCVCSGELMAANFGSELEAVGTTFESCDHGLYVANLANLQSCTFVHKSWANLIAAQLQYPFKDGETKVKTQYSETHAEYANLGLCYIGSSDYNAIAIMNNCLEQTDSEKNAHIVLTTNYGHKAPSLYLSNHTALYSIRVDPDRGKGAAKLYVGENVTIPSFGDTVGDVDESSYAGIGFYSGFNVHEGLHNGITQVDKKLNEKMASVDYTYLPKYRTGSDPLLHFGGFSESSTEYQIAHLSEVIDPSVAYFVAKDGKETYIQPELITEELKTKYHVSSGMSNDARYYIPITDELIVLEYYISSTEAYYYLHTSADSIGTVEEVYVGKAQKLIDDSYASYYNLWSAQKTKEAISTTANAIYGETKVLEGTAAPTRLTVGALGQKYLDTNTGKMYLCVEIKKFTDMVEQVIYGWQPLFIPDYQKDNISDLYLPIGNFVYDGTPQELCRVGSRSEGGNSYLYGIEINFIQNSNAPDPGGYFEKDTIGGQLQELGAGKVNRSTGKLKVYATDKDGNTISSISYSIAADANTFPLRDSNGNIKVGTPVEGEDAVPKSYADGKLDKITTTDGYNRAYGVSYEGNQMSFRVANSALASALALRDSKGNIKVGTPVEDGDAAPKSYVDGKLDKITATSTYSKVYGIEKDGAQTSFTVTTGTTIGGLPMWDGNGTLKTNAPVNNVDCTNKRYVDALKQSTNPNTANTAGHIGQLCLVGSSDVNPYDVYICVMSNPENSTYVWHKMCTTEAPS